MPHLFDSREDTSDWPMHQPRYPWTRKRSQNDPFIPMINLVFLILTFFLATGSMRAADTLNIAPVQSTATAAMPSADVILYIGASGQLALGKRPLAPADLFAALDKRLKAEAVIRVLIKADRAVTADRILPLLQKLKSLGLGTVTLVTVKRKHVR